jgi:ATP-binding cassette subfamily B protein
MVQQYGFIEETLRVIGQPQTVLDAPGARPLVTRRGSIVFRNVSFAYGGGRDAVHELDLEIPAGQKVGVVGPSGAGKSTCINLLQRLYDVDRGMVLIDGQAVTAVTQDSLRAALAVVPQEIVLFHRTIMENIRFARPDATDEEVIAAARAAHCHGFISRLADGYETMVGERGARLSGGQRQRIGIARAFLKDAPIILLDEATSALDTESERLVQEAIDRLLRGRTVFVIAHRLSTVAHATRILVLDQGRVVEEGTHEELLARRGTYHRLHALQFPRGGEAA